MSRCLYPPFRWLPALLLLTVLGACGPGRNEFAPACPSPTFLQGVSDLSRYRPGSTGRDLTDLVLQARLTGLQGNCTEGSSARLLDTSVSVTMEVVRGPAMQGRQVDVPIFLAVTEGETILNKEVYAVAVEFPPNVDRATVATPVLQVTLPIGPDKSGAAYGIIAGFQLTPEELQLNRPRR